MDSRTRKMKWAAACVLGAGCVFQGGCATILPALAFSIGQTIFFRTIADMILGGLGGGGGTAGG